MVSSLVALSTTYSGVVTLPQSCSQAATCRASQLILGQARNPGTDRSSAAQAASASILVSSGTRLQWPPVYRTLGVDRRSNQLDEGFEQVLLRLDQRPAFERHRRRSRKGPGTKLRRRLSVAPASQSRTIAPTSSVLRLIQRDGDGVARLAPGQQLPRPEASQVLRRCSRVEALAHACGSAIGARSNGPASRHIVKRRRPLARPAAIPEWSSAAWAGLAIVPASAR
jgi:hypothetical protein